MSTEQLNIPYELDPEQLLEKALEIKRQEGLLGSESVRKAFLEFGHTVDDHSPLFFDLVAKVNLKSKELKRDRYRNQGPDD